MKKAYEMPHIRVINKLNQILYTKVCNDNQFVGRSFIVIKIAYLISQRRILILAA